MLFMLAFASPCWAETNSKSGRIELPSKEEIKNLPANGGEKFNRLIFEQSPYLLQHAANPVDWYPWGKEAFERAAKENKMIFLSIGYSTCHWCHVMEHESFEDPEVARLMNETFVCIKVDREERPDVDNIYMTVTQAMTGTGGWPMSVVLTPEKKPFFAGTYFPKNGKFGKPGMLQLIPRLEDIWKTKQEDAKEYAENLVLELNKLATKPPGSDIPHSALENAFLELRDNFDEEEGGFKSQRKFPLPHKLMFLLRYWYRSGDAQALEMVEKTLRSMRRGGLWDHIGFGTHRYSTDPQWLLPHFEKMLYDQALLSMVHVETFQVTKDDFYKQTAEEIFQYVLRDMTSPEGGFFSAEDADSEGEEGLFYTWKKEEIYKLLPKNEANEFIAIFGFEDDGNFQDESTHSKTGRNIPHLDLTIEQYAKKNNLDELELKGKWLRWRKILFNEREKRIHPLKDDKILTDWNGLMIAAFAKGGRAFANKNYIAAAEKAANFILTNLKDPDGRLFKRYRNGESGLTAHLEDYTFLCWGLIELYQATQNPAYLAEAISIAKMFIELFHDDTNLGFYLVAEDSEKLIAPAKEIYDGAIPSGNSVAAYCLIQLSKLTGDLAFEEKAEGVFKAFSSTVIRAPSNFCLLMTAFDLAQGPSSEILIAGNESDKSYQKIVSHLHQAYLPRSVMISRNRKTSSQLDTLIPFSSEQNMINSKTTVYVCENYACRKPVHTLSETLGIINSVSKSKNK